MFLSLTPRRLEALEVLSRLSAEAGSAVHYSLVGARMRISAWTAYDLLRELEKLGLVARRYAQGEAPAVRGRSRILFAPVTLRVTAAVAGSSRGLDGAYSKFAAMDEAGAARAYLADAGRDLGVEMAYWLSRLDAAGRQGTNAARTVLEGGTAPLAKVQALASMGLGSALARLGASRLAGRVTAAATAFTAHLEEVAGGSEEAMIDLVEASRRVEMQ